jgi:hypothetical protein
MSLLSILKTAGKDLSHVGGWIEDGLKIAAPIIGTFDPPIGAILTEVETIITNVQKQSATPVTSEMIQAITTAVSTLAGIKGVAVTPQPSLLKPSS